MGISAALQAPANFTSKNICSWQLCWHWINSTYWGNLVKQDFRTIVYLIHQSSIGIGNTLIGRAQILICSTGHETTHWVVSLNTKCYPGIGSIPRKEASFLTLPPMSALNSAWILCLKPTGSLFITSSCTALRGICGFSIWTWALLSVARRWCQQVKLGGCGGETPVIIASLRHHKDTRTTNKIPRMHLCTMPKLDPKSRC